MKKIFIIALLTFTAVANAQQADANTENIPKGWIKVHKDGFTGYIDDTGVEIVPAVYDEIGDFGTYCPDTAVIVQNGLMGLIDLQGAELCKPQYETLLQSDKFPNGWIMVQKDEFYGFINCKGQETVKPVYEQIETAITNTNKE